MKVQLAKHLSAEQQQSAETELRLCVHCGLCNATCPTYQLTQNECEGPRGRIYLIKQVLEAKPASRQTLRYLEHCLQCRACETTCPSGVRYSQLLPLGLQYTAHQQTRIKRGQKALLSCLLSDSTRFAVALTLARLVKPILPKTLAKHIPARRPLLSLPQSNAIKTQRVLIAGSCVQNSLAPQINQATIYVLENLGFEVIIAPEACCGGLAQHLQDTEHARTLARKSIDLYWSYLEAGVTAIVSNASGCGVFIKEYAELLKDDIDYAEKAQRTAFACRDLTEILIEQYFSQFQARTETIALHIPCTLQHGQKLNGVLEKLLSRLGYRCVLTHDPHLCCGSAGVYSLLEPKTAEQLAHKKIATLTVNQPSCIVTANIGCLTHLQAYTPLPVRHWIELLAEDWAKNKPH